MNNIPMDFWIAFAVVLVQMALCHVLLARLKRENFKVFEQMGSPHLLWNNTPRTMWLFWRWLCSSAPQREGNGTLCLVWIIRLLTVGFLVWFVAQLLFRLTGL